MTVTDISIKAKEAGMSYGEYVNQMGPICPSQR